jgi:hypothetical protein
MGLAVETIGFSAVNPGAVGAAAVMAGSDSNRVRNFGGAGGARLVDVFRQGATTGFVRLVSPALHDVSRGITLLSAETPFRFPFPRETGQPLAAGDTLAITLSGGAAETDVGAAVIYYDDLDGISARLYSWPDIVGAIDTIKPVQVNFNTAAPGTWVDTAVNATEDLLDADYKYAVLGYLTDTALCVIGCRGQETGNLRLCGPGAIDTNATADYFVRASQDLGKPYIPVFSANNKAGFQVSALGTPAAATAVQSQLILARLRPGF